MRTLRGAGQWLSERAEWCTKTSTPPPRGLMNPKPFSSYHFFTYPCSRSLRAKEAGAVLEKARRKKKRRRRRRCYYYYLCNYCYCFFYYY